MALFIVELKYVIAYLSISHARIVFSTQWRFIWELIKKYQILLPILALTQAPESQASCFCRCSATHHTRTQSTHPHSEKHHILGCTRSIWALSDLPDGLWMWMGGRKSCCKKNSGQKVSRLTSSFVQPCGVYSRKSFPMSFNFARSGARCVQLSSHLTSTGTILLLGRKDSNQHQNVLHIHTSCSINT